MAPKAASSPLDVMTCPVSQFRHRCAQRTLWYCFPMPGEFERQRLVAIGLYLADITWSGVFWLESVVGWMRCNGDAAQHSRPMEFVNSDRGSCAPKLNSQHNCVQSEAQWAKAI